MSSETANRSVLVALASMVVVAVLAIVLIGTDREGVPTGGPPPPATGANSEDLQTASADGRVGSDAGRGVRDPRSDPDTETREPLDATRELDPVTRDLSDATRSRLVIAVESETGERLPGAAVTIRGDDVAERVTGGDGLAIFDGIPEGGYRVLLSAPGYPELQSAAPVRVPRGTTEEMRCVARRFDALISGRVMDSTGAPVAGVDTRSAPLHRQDDEILLERVGSPSRTDSDAQGRFEISGLAAGEYTIETEPQVGYSQARQNIIAPFEGLVLVLNEEHSIVISGVVTDQSSRPLEGAEVVAAAGGSTRTDEQGRYRLPLRVNRAPGSTLALSARKAGYSERHKTTAVSGEPTTAEVELSFQLEVLTDVGTLLGTLVDPSGAPIPGESVYLQSLSRSARHHAMASPDGRFRFESVRFADDYVLTVYPASDYWDKTIQPVEIAAGESQLEVVLEPIEKAMFNGTLVDAVGAPVPHFTVWVKNLGQRAGSTRVTSDSLGRFRAPVPAGDLMIETRALPKLTVRGLRVEPGQEFSATLPIGIGDRTVRGQVRLPDGSPVAGARVVVTWSHSETGVHSSLFHETLSDRFGSFELPGLGPGTCAVSVSAVGVSSTRLRFQIPNRGSPDLLRIELR